VILATPRQEALRERGASGADELGGFGKFIVLETAKWAKVVKEAGIKSE